MKKLAALLILISLVSLRAESLSLKECIALGLKSNPDYRISLYRVHAAKNNYLSSYSPFIPSLQTSFSYAHNKSKTDRVGQDGIIVTGNSEYDYYSGGFSSGITLFDLSDFFQIRSSKAYYQSIQFSHKQNELDLILDITTQYFNTLAYKKLAAASIDNINRTQKQLDKIQQMFDLDIVSQIDLIKQQGLVGKAKLDSITNVKSYQTALGKLNEIMGRSPDTPLELEDYLDTNYVQLNYYDLVKYAQENHPGLNYYR
ncbi:MAG: TolC family protein, partial [Candidatus Delongbacteria bacterium]|nr:TolC family protein [Candidatus Delongbacteria bacterium]